MRRSFLICAVFLMLAPGFSSGQEVGQMPSPMTVVSTLTDLDIRDILTNANIPGEKITIREEKDSEGLTAFYVFEGDSILLALYQYTNEPGEKVTSLGMSVGNRMARGADVRKINDWNAKTRYVKAYVDDEGDAMLSTDMLLSPGVTRLTVQEWVKMFAKFSREFTEYLKP
jgi:hypothetical protein